MAQAFRQAGESSAINPTKEWGIGPVLYGSVSEWIIQYKKGLRKFNNFERLLEQDPTGQIMQVCTYNYHQLEEEFACITHSIFALDSFIAISLSLMLVELPEWHTHNKNYDSTFTWEILVS